MVLVGVVRGYLREYDARYRVFDKRALFRHVVEKAEALGLPLCRRVGRRGRNFALTPCQYVALIVVAVFGGLTTKHLNRTRFREESRVRKWQHALGITHNLQTYMRLSFRASHI